MATFIQGTGQVYAPTPSSPIPVNVVSGDNEVVVTGKNIYNKATSINNKTFTTNTGVLTDNSNYITSDFIKVSPNTTYYVYGLTVVGGYDNNKNWVALVRNADTNGTFTTPNNCYYVRIRNYSFLPTEEEQNARSEVTYLTLGNQPITYVPYQSQNYPLYLGVENLFDKTDYTNGKYLNTDGHESSNSDYGFSNYIAITSANNYYLSGLASGGGNTPATCFYDKDKTLISGERNENRTVISYSSIPSNAKYMRISFKVADLNTIELTKGSSPQHISDTPIELNKIGTYQDYIYKDNGSWYLHKEIGKVVLNGSETFTNHNTQNSINSYRIELSNVLAGVFPLANYYKGVSFTATFNSSNRDYGEIATHNTANNYIYFSSPNSTDNNLSSFKNWLATNNLIVYYVLATATETEITNTTLINQLETLKGAMSYEGQTNISQVNNDLPFILKVKGIKEGSGEGIINNIGNIYAKPIIELEGTGNIGIYKNGTQYFEVDMSNDSKITIDTENMEAYHNGVLKNRQVIGDYNKFTIDEGNNNIEITGELTKATITKYTRYL